MAHICMIAGCDNHIRTVPKVSMFYIPADSVAKFWGISKQFRDGSMQFSEFMNTGYLRLKVCEKHFLPKDIQILGNRKSLTTNATPHQLDSPSLSLSMSQPTTHQSASSQPGPSGLQTTGAVASTLADQAQQVSQLYCPAKQIFFHNYYKVS